ncbi:putative F-box associated interaction domain, F-box-like domain superfamily [Helianthus annuus]|nr:putative F-box associated interaction domain, F-box-like domain superfamily [Helianthus annuus]KAJ0643551.1 putative F-box associated interaction domain, F-box-like domain superfamily [Helianthus annuus]KAJ0834203.1 putative F-box associated interaction domain, F-box-like domain superfamily [Helianthus annuus]
MWTKKTKGDEVPFSLIESEILPRVAAKSDIGRCRCVCKQWKSFLSTPTFGKMHLRLHGTTIDDYKVVILDGPTLCTLCPSKPNQQAYILSSLDGLVCLGLPESSQLVFWNPFTGVSRKLASNPHSPFDYSASCHDADVVGFYKDSSSNDYKLLYLSCGGYFGAYIYSHTSDTWREIKIDFDADICDAWSPATLCGQCLYFAVSAYIHAQRQMHWWIICFDVETETFRKICCPPLPDDDDIRSYCASLVLLNGFLHLYVSYTIFINDICSKQCNLWRMMDADGWVKVVAFCDPLDEDNFTMQQRICTASTGSWLAVLDEDNNSLTKINSEDFITHYRHFSSPSFEYTSRRAIYVETLVSPNP